MRSLFLFSFVSAGVVFSCPEALDLRVEIKVTRDYGGIVESYDDVNEGDWKKVIMPKGDYFLSGDLDLVKNRGKKCEYKASGVSISGNGFEWKSDEEYKARIESGPRGGFKSFHLNAFEPTKVYSVKGESGKKLRRTYEGERPLYIGANYKTMDDTSAVFEGPLAYFDFGDGHEYYGRAKVSLSQD